jgi:hypothetical protein
VSVATFSPPIKATVSASSLPCVVIGMRERGDGFIEWLAIDPDGGLVHLLRDEFTFDFRYDIASGIWSDPAEQQGDEFGDDE